MEFIETNKTKSNQVIPQITASSLDKLIVERKFTLIDVRAPSGIENQGAIPGAINIPLEEAISQIDDRLSTPNSIFNGEGPFLFCCTGGVMSYMAAIHAQEKGIKRVYNLEGGHAAWEKLKQVEIVQ